MTTTEAFLMTPNDNEPASADARTVASDAGREETVSQGAAEVCLLTLSEAKSKRAELWQKMERAEKALKVTDEWKRHDQIETEWQQWERIVQAMTAAEKMNVKMKPMNAACGCSRSTGQCGQAEHLRDAMATGKLTANEANEAY